MVGHSRNTIIKYIDEYENAVRKLIIATGSNENVETEALVEELSKAPNYESSLLNLHLLNYDIIDKIELFSTPK